jgi:hypothetical protein
MSSPGIPNRTYRASDFTMSVGPNDSPRSSRSSITNPYRPLSSRKSSSNKNTPRSQTSDFENLKIMRDADVSMKRRLTWQYGYPIDNKYSSELKCWIADNATEFQQFDIANSSRPKITRKQLIDIIRNMPQAVYLFIKPF